MKKPMALIFDLGSTILRETIVNRLSGVTRLLEIAHNPRKTTVQEIMELLGKVEEDIKIRRKESMVEFSFKNLQKLMFDWYNISFDLSPEDLELEFWKSSYMVTMEPDAGRSLEAMFKTNLPLAVVTNSAFSGNVLMWELACQNIDTYFQFLMSSADYGYRKPHPFIFLAAAERIMLEPYEIWYVGDSYINDIIGAANVGMKPVWYNPDYLPSEETHHIAQVHNWLELVELLVKVM